MCVSCALNRLSLNTECAAEIQVETATEGTFESLTGVESQVGTPAEGAFEPLDSIGSKDPVGTSTEREVEPPDSTGAEGPVWTSTEGAIGPLHLSGVGTLTVTPIEGTGGSHPHKAGANKLVHVEGNKESRYNRSQFQGGTFFCWQGGGSIPIGQCTGSGSI